MEIRFRFDKSATNFHKRRYQTVNHYIFNSIDAAVSIIHQANLLNILAHEPICAFHTKKARAPYTFLKDSDITLIMREALKGIT